MVLLQSFVSVLYWVLILYVSGLLVWNLSRSRKWEEEILLVIVLVPFLLRLFRLK